MEDDFGSSRFGREISDLRFEISYLSSIIVFCTTSILVSSIKTVVFSGSLASEAVFNSEKKRSSSANWTPYFCWFFFSL